MSAKRLLDLALAGSVLLVTAPVLLLAMALVRWRLGAPVLFRQVRPGLHGTPFTIVKLRSMRDATDALGNPLPDAERLTALGRWLRRLSIDELPQLLNVLRGEMSIVGPRPLLMQYLPLYSPRQARRHEVLPGITGWAQVNGRNALSWPERLELDVWYVEHQSFRLDCYILWRSLASVASGRGVSADGEATVQAFRGEQLPASATKGTTGRQDTDGVPHG
jgi:lipopolysaccharide/colanic/teichoic acid biosynthesis glycosyltransferase